MGFYGVLYWTCGDEMSESLGASHCGTEPTAKAKKTRCRLDSGHHPPLPG